MQDVLDVLLSFLTPIIWGAFGAVSGFLLQFFPDADSGVVAAIGSWADAMTGFQLSFNVFYFIDLGVASVFVSITVVVVLAFLLLTMIRAVISVVHKVADAIPVFG